MTEQNGAGSERVRVAGEAVLFGFEPTEVQLDVRPRPLRWRVTGAAQRMGVALLVAPAVTVVPPHAPWLIGVLTGGFVLARRRWMERLTLERVEGVCPKCGEALSVKAGRLRIPHPVTCEGCHHQCSVRLPSELLAELGAEPA